MNSNRTLICRVENSIADTLEQHALQECSFAFRRGYWHFVQAFVANPVPGWPCGHLKTREFKCETSLSSLSDLGSNSGTPAIALTACSLRRNSVRLRVKMMVMNRKRPAMFSFSIMRAALQQI